MTNQGAKMKLGAALEDMEKAAATNDQQTIAIVAGYNMARVLSVILHLIKRQDELSAEIAELKTRLAFAGYEGKRS